MNSSSIAHNGGGTLTAEAIWQHLKDACLRSGGKLVVPEHERDQFLIILHRKGAFHGIQNSQQGDGTFLNQVAVQDNGGQTLYFEFFSHVPIK